MIYGAQGVTQTAQQATTKVWNISQLDAPKFLSRLVRSIAGLVIIGGAFVLNAAMATFATSVGVDYFVRIPVLLGMVLINVVLYLLAFRVLTPAAVATRALAPGAALGAIGFTILITLGSGLVQHQVKHSSAVYGQFGIVIGLVGFLLLLAKISLYGAELNPVVARRLWPRALQGSDPTEADNQVLHDIVHESLRRRDQRVGVGFGDHAEEEAQEDVVRNDRTLESVGPTGRTGSRRDNSGDR